MATRAAKAPARKPASKTAPAKTIGRPPEYTEEIADFICEEIADGRSLRSICAAEGMPRKATVFRWLADPRYKSFRDRYTHAREAQADALADEILDLADECRIGRKTVIKGRKKEVTEGDMVERARLQIDARKWLAGKLRPKVYGEKPDGEASASMSKEQLLRELANGLPD